MKENKNIEPAVVEQTEAVVAEQPAADVNVEQPVAAEAAEQPAEVAEQAAEAAGQAVEAAGQAVEAANAEVLEAVEADNENETKKAPKKNAKREGAYERMLGTLNAAVKATEDFAQERASKGMSTTRVKNALRTIKDVKKVMAQYGSN